MNPATVARVRLAALLLVAIVFQTTLAADLRISGVAPDVMLLIAVCAGLSGGAEQGAVVGFVAGLLTDLFLTTTPVGMAALADGLVGFAVGGLRATVLPEGRFLTPVMAALGTAAGVLGFVVIGALVGQPQLSRLGTHWLVRVMVVEGVDAAVLALPVSWLVDRAGRGSKGFERVRRAERITAK